MLLITCVRDCQCASFILSDDKQPASKILARTPLLLGLSMRHRLFCCQGARSQLVLAQTFHTYYHLRWQTLSTVHNIWCTSYHKQLRICTSCTNIWSSSTSRCLEVVLSPHISHDQFIPLLTQGQFCPDNARNLQNHSREKTLSLEEISLDWSQHCFISTMFFKNIIARLQEPFPHHVLAAYLMRGQWKVVEPAHHPHPPGENKEFQPIRGQDCVWAPAALTFICCFQQLWGHIADTTLKRGPSGMEDITSAVFSALDNLSSP